MTCTWRTGRYDIFNRADEKILDLPGSEIDRFVPRDSLDLLLEQLET